uniref:Metalloproteinase inhibitor 2 n=1 Tax=Oncorhynchus mykiss TaxID=8022 RepID=A0A8K9X0L4_ONCMY
MTRYVSSCFITLFVLFLWRVEDIADACKCSPPHPQKAFCDAEIVIRAKVVGKKAVSNAIKYDIQQIKMFKCPDQVIHAIFTAPSPAACGVTLDLNKEYLFTGEVLTTLPTFCCQHWLTLSVLRLQHKSAFHLSACPALRFHLKCFSTFIFRTTRATSKPQNNLMWTLALMSFIDKC